MAALSYSFCMSILHSFWQAGLLLLLYSLISKLFLQRHAALEKRNLLFATLGTQLVLSILTFFIYYINTSDNAAEGSLNALIAPVLAADIVHALAPYLFILYNLVLSYKLMKAIYTWQQFKKQYKAGLEKPGIDLRLFTTVKTHHLGIKRKVTLWLSSTVSTPVTFGFFRPIILLPVSLVNKISLQQAETLILHELSHIRVNDYLLNWFLVLTETIFFFNPFLLAFCKAIRMEREKNCDTTVITFNYPATLYAETLLQAERVKQLIPGFQLAAVTKKTQLLQRIQFFTNADNFTPGKQNKFIGPAIAIAIAFVFITALFFQLPTIKKEQQPITDVSPVAIEAPVFTLAEIPTPVINTSFTDKIAADAEKIAAAAMKHQPEIDNHLLELAPLIKSIEDNAAAVAENAQQYIVTPVALTENDATRQIIVKEEQSGSKNASVKVYEMRFENGQWIIQPEWMASMKGKIADSLRRMIDTSIKLLRTQ